MTYRIGHGHPRYQKIEGRRPGGLLAELRRIRIEKDIGQEILCERIGIPRNTLSGWECGHMKPGLFLLQAWANALGYELTLTEMQI